MKRSYQIVLLFCIALPVMAMKIPSQVKKTVTFIFVKDSANRLQPSGTGFFMQVHAHQGGDTANFGYLVTTRSSIQGTNGRYCDSVFIRINRKDNYSDTLIMPLTQNGIPRYFLHPDSTVDLIMIPAYPDAGRYDFLFTPATMTAPVDFIKKESINEGDEFFSTGMLRPQLGTFRNIPSVIHSRLVQLSEEKYPGAYGLTELYVTDAPFRAGSNGSPFFYYIPASKDSTVSAKFILAGVVSGDFAGSRSERGGLTAVVPAYRVLEMMNMPAAAAERQREFQRIRLEKEKKQ